jgi:hypothetical protein
MSDRDMNNQPESESLPYHKPMLTVYGNIRTLTLAMGSGGILDNASAPPTANKTMGAMG